MVDTETDVVLKKQVSEWLTSQQSDRPVVEYTTTDMDSKKTVKKSSPLNNSQLRRENVDQLSVIIDRQQEAHLYNVYTKKEPSKASKNSFQENL